MYTNAPFTYNYASITINHLHTQMCMCVFLYIFICVCARAHVRTHTNQISHMNLYTTKFGVHEQKYFPKSCDVCVYNNQPIKIHLHTCFLQYLESIGFRTIMIQVTF